MDERTIIPTARVPPSFACSPPICPTKSSDKSNKRNDEEVTAEQTTEDRGQTSRSRVRCQVIGCGQPVFGIVRHIPEDSSLERIRESSWIPVESVLWMGWGGPSWRTDQSTRHRRSWCVHASWVFYE